MLCSVRQLFVSVVLLLVWVGLSTPDAHPAWAQQRIRSTNPKTTKSIRRPHPEGRFVQPKGEVRFIAEFKPKSIARKQAELSQRSVPKKARSGRIESHRARLESLLDRFRQDLQEIASSQKSQQKAVARGVEVQVTREYFTVLSGAAIIAHQKIAWRLRALPYVEDTYPDRRVEATVGDARKIIDAGKLRAEQGATGDGVEIGIIDTGVDYTHPALGGGFGPGNKVVGGHDFVNEDDDPMDDNGHGIHVAGIAAANGDSITGIAPEAKLWAYKMLSSRGTGSASDAIAAIERAVEDSVDVINMSWGTIGGLPSVPVSKATDNASLAGVLPVTSAGNAGPEYQSVGAPGSARRAITVGASSDSDRIADFSSRGPIRKVYTVKPDVVAPGVNIRSTQPHGDYGKLSGTSMASPVVAGTAALLLELHPGWSPTFVKGTLMKASVDLGEDIWTQGRGRIDADNAAETKVVATPAILSFGLVDNTENIWTRTDTLTFRNRGEAARTYQLSTGPSPASGLSVNLSTTSVTVAGGDSTLVPITAQVDNDVAPYPEDRPPAFTGRVVATSSQDTIKVPYALARPPTVTFSFSSSYPGGVGIQFHRSKGDPPAYAWDLGYGGSMTGLNGFRPGYKPDQYTAVLPETGEYDFIAQLTGCFSHPNESCHPGFIIHEDVSVPETQTLAIGSQQAKHKVVLNVRDENGAPVPVGDSRGLGTVVVHESGEWTREPVFVDTLLFSSMSDEYVIRGMTVGETFEGGRRKLYRFPYQFRGLSGDLTLSNDPKDLRKTIYRLGSGPAPSTSFINLTHFFRGTRVRAKPGQITDWMSYPSYPNPEAHPTPIVREFYVLPRPKETYDDFPKGRQNYNLYPSFKVLDRSEDLPNFTSAPTVYKAGIPQVAGPDTTVFYQPGDRKPGSLAEGLRRSVDNLGVIEIGEIPPHFAVGINPQGELTTGQSEGWFEGPFSGIRKAQVDIHFWGRYTLSRSNFISTDPSSKIRAGDSLLVSIPHDIAGRSGQTELRFAHGSGDLRPQFRDLVIFSGGQVSDTLFSSRENEIRASLKSSSAVESMSAYVRAADSSAWRKIESFHGGGSLRAEVPSTLSTGYYAVRIVAKGRGGGRVEQVSTPAFWLKQQRPVASETKHIDSGGPVDFGDTGVFLSFSGVERQDSVTVEKYDEGPSGNEGISEQNVSNYRFLISAGNGLRFDSSKVELAVSTLSGIDDPANVRIYRRDEAGTGAFTPLKTSADDNGTPSDASDDTLSAWASSFSEFALASDTEPLPVELTAFDATVAKGKVRLTWQTASERKSAGFKVQRRAGPQDAWQKVGFVESKAQGGSSSEPLSYRFTDADLPYAADSLTYRLQQVDADGTKHRSEAVTVRRAVGEVQFLKTYPNPARQKVTLRFALPERQEAKIHLYDVLGRRVKTVVNDKREGRQEIQLDVSGLSSGVYFLRLQAGNDIRTRRLTVVR